MITLEQAKKLSNGQIIFHAVAKNADGSPMRWRVNGMVKLWKRNPKRIQVPLKHGLYDHGYLVESNLKEFFLTEEKVKMAVCSCGLQWQWDFDVDTFFYANTDEEVKTVDLFPDSGSVEDDDDEIHGVTVYICSCGKVNSAIINNGGATVVQIKEWDKIDWENDLNSYCF